MRTRKEIKNQIESLKNDIIKWTKEKNEENNSEVIVNAYKKSIQEARLTMDVLEWVMANDDSHIQKGKVLRYSPSGVKNFAMGFEKNDIVVVNDINLDDLNSCPIEIRLVAINPDGKFRSLKGFVTADDLVEL